MIITPITEKNKEEFNKKASHPLQSYEWGEFRKETGIKTIRLGQFEHNKLEQSYQLTLHPIPHTPWSAGYGPKITQPNQKLLESLQTIGKDENAIFFQLEPNVKKHETVKNSLEVQGLVPAARPLFTKFTFVLDLTKPEDELLQNLHSKTRYNVRVAKRHGVVVTEDNSDTAFESYIRLLHETTQRQKFYAHGTDYHRSMWKMLKAPATFSKKESYDDLTAHLLVATYTPPHDSTSYILTAWIVFVFHDTLYYPYGTSSSLYRETMSSNLMMWEAILFGKKLGLKKFDMWGALGPEPDPQDPWYGFHRFKQGYGPELIEFVGSYDYVIRPPLYSLYKIADKARWLYLKLRK